MTRTRLAVMLGPLLVLVLAGATGCGLLPTSGPVTTVNRSQVAPSPPPADFVAPGPSDGAPPVAVVEGFLTALTGVPLSTSTARRFLVSSDRNAWHPDDGTLAYDQVRLRALTPTGADSAEVQLDLTGVRRYDSRGAWMGKETTERLRFRVVREGAQWRLADPPDLVLVPTWYLDEQYEALRLWFFDPTFTILVSERVFLPRTDDLATTLVRALLRGPTGSQDSSVGAGLRTAFPLGSALDLSVVVRPDGVAEVSLRGNFPPPSDERLRQVVAQLSQTIRQVPNVRRMRVLVKDSPLTLPGGRRTVEVDVPPAFDTVGVGTAELYGIRAQRVRSGARAEVPVTGVFGRTGLALRSIAVRPSREPGGDPRGDGIAGVGQDGRSVLVGAPAGASASTTRRVYSGLDVLRPSYSLDGSLWLVDRRGADGARVVLVRDGSWEAVPVPGVSGEAVIAFVVSPDGGSLVAVVRSASGPRVVLSRLVRRADGSVVRASAARTLATVTSPGRVADLVWHGSQDLAVLREVTSGKTTVSEVTFASLDGSPGDRALVPPDTWTGAATGLVGSPVDGAPLYLVAGRRLLQLDESTARWRRSDIPDGLGAPTYPG